MDNFIQHISDQIPSYFARSILAKSKINTCEFNFVEEKSVKINLIKNRRNSQYQPPKNIFNKQQTQHHKPSYYKILKVDKRQETIQTSQRQNSEYLKQLNTIKTCKSQQKLPTLSKCIVELKVKQNPHNLIRVNKQPIKPKLNKKVRISRQVSEKHCNLPRNQVEEQNKIKEDAFNEKQIQNKQKERQHFINKIMLSSCLTREMQFNQKTKINIIMSKLRQTEKRGRLSVNFLQRKVQKSPCQLIANKLQCEQISKNNTKQQIMKKFSLQLGIQTKKKEIKSQNTQKKQQNYVSAWHVQGYLNSLEQNQEFQ